MSFAPRVSALVAVAAAVLVLLSACARATSNAGDDGMPFTARDVAFSWRLIMNPRNNVLHREVGPRSANHAGGERALLQGPAETGAHRAVDPARRQHHRHGTAHARGRHAGVRRPAHVRRFRTTPGLRAVLTGWNSQRILMLDDARPALRHVEVRRAIARAIDLLRAVGIGVTIKSYPYKGVFAFDGPIVNGRFDLAVFANTLRYDPDSTSTLTCANFAPKGENESRTCDPAIDRLERAGLATDDPRKRAAIYRAIGRRVHDTVPFIPLFAQRRVSVFNDDLRGYDPAPVAAPWWNAYQWSI